MSNQGIRWWSKGLDTFISTKTKKKEEEKKERVIRHCSRKLD